MADVRKAEGIREFLKTRREPHDDLIEDVQNLLMPWRGDITTRLDASTERITGHYDSTGTNALATLANFVVGNVFPPGGDWLRLEAKRAEGKQGILDEAAEEIMSELDDSNFYIAASTWLKDLIGIGNGTFLTEARTERMRADGSLLGGLDFEAVPYAAVWRYLDRNQRPLLMCREWKMHPVEANRFFGQEVGKELEHEELTVVNVIYEEKGKYESCWYLDGSSKILRKSTLPYMPYVFAMWDRVDGEDYGVGQGHLARPTVAGMQEMSRQVYQAAGRDLNPLLSVPDDAHVRTDMANNGQLIMRRPLSAASPEYVTSGSNFAAADGIRRLDAEQVRIAFMSDLLLEPETQPRSAEESRQRAARLFQRLSGPSQVVNNALGEVVKTIITVMRQAGALQMMDEIEEKVSISFTSPFFTIQRQQQMQKVLDYMAFKAQMVQLMPEEQAAAVMDDLDLDKVSAYVGSKSDIPQFLFRDKSQVETIRDGRDQLAVEELLAAAPPETPPIPSPNPLPPGG